jgi:hypothetical protein
MQKLIALLTAGCLTLALSVQGAEKPEDPNAKKQKPKNVQKQQVAPKQQQLKTPNTHVQQHQQHVERVNKPVTNTRNIDVSKKPRTLPPRTNSPANVQTTNIESNKIKKNKDQLLTNKQQKQIQANNQQQLQTNTQPQTQNNNQQLQKNKLNAQSIQKIRAQHKNFHARPNTSIASVRFNQSYRITNAQNWNKPQYQVFRSYQPQWHDQGWWKSHHRRLSLISGGWYFWDAGYWYPAWGYDDGAAYYPYDGPIYSGPSARPFDQVVADVQSALQEQGYYKGEVDGLLGPLTRQALAEYQQANGLYATETIDQPTLQTLGLAG